jgi:cytidyltransferase-like protein
VDVPNATVMLIEGANRFGLAQLHQLRGRVGAAEQSYCLLIPDKEDAVENERLAVMSETNDGFVLAERDLQQRGPGEFLGTRQAGFSELKMANLTDVRLIEKARSRPRSCSRDDPDLSAPEHQLLAKSWSSSGAAAEEISANMVRALFPGTFDPIHYGHIDIARRASRLFDELFVAVYDRPLKSLLFSPEERLSLVNRPFRTRAKST